MTDWIPSLERAFKRFISDPSYRPMTRRELAAAMGLSLEQRRALRDVLRRMQAAGDLVLLRKNRWALPDAGGRFVGELSVDARGDGWVTDRDHPERVARIPSDDLRCAVPGDRVCVEWAGRPGGRLPIGPPERRPARIVRVVERLRPVVTGLLKQGRHYWYVIPSTIRYPSNVHVLGFADGVASRDGRLVAIELAAWSPSATRLEGRVVEDLGLPGDPAAEICALIRRVGLVDSFPHPAVAEARAVARAARSAGFEGRRDLRDTAAFTIDPMDAKDFDDAVAVARRNDGGWDLYVHIADVARYVPPHSAVDREARSRGTSVYLADRTLTMLPPDLTADVCSLGPDRDRLCRTIRFHIAADGRVVDEEFYPSVIRSRARLNYDEVSDFLAGGDPPGVPRELRDSIVEMARLAAILRRRRIAGGALAFTLPEVRCELDASGRVAGFRRRGADDAYALIEEMMLLANRAVARRMARANGPAIYRIHDAPDDRQWEDMREALSELGLRSFAPSSHGLNALLRSLDGTPLQPIAAMTVLRHLKRAMYSTRCGSHFGLAVRPYTHFTSPIRRYPDLVVHRLLDAIENGRPPPHGHDDVETIAAHATWTERRADEAERESVDLKRIEFYRDLLARGDTGPWPAVVVGRASRGVLVELEDTLQRGLVPDHFLRGRPTPGARLMVELLRIDERRRLVDFRPEARAARRPGRRRLSG